MWRVRSLLSTNLFLENDLEPWLEPISKLLEEHRDARKLHKPEEVGGITLSTNDQPSLPLAHGKEPYHEPATFVLA